MRLFDELILVSIGKRSSLNHIPSEEEWQCLFAEAKKQALAGVLFDALSSLPEDQFPPVSVAREWMSQLVRIENGNQLNSQRAAELCRMLRKDGFRSVILKGPGVSSYYPRPDARQSGDIDVWVEGGHKKISAYLKSRFPVRNIQIHHADAGVFMDVETEIHFRPSWSYAPWVDRKYCAWYDRQWERQCANVTENGYCVPTVEFNLVYLLMHIYRHIFIEGIGLRQLMDYYYVLRASSPQERGAARSTLNQLSLGRFASAVMYVLGEVFGLEEGGMVCHPDRKGRFLLDEIVEGGNFGMYSRQESMPKKDTRVSRGFRRAVHNLRLLTLYPEEVVCYPFWMVWHWCWKKKNQYL